MRLPNGYGSVVKLGKGRRKPYAVRVTKGVEKGPDGRYRQKYKYLEYFEKSKDAYAYLAQLNSGNEVKEHIALKDQPTFEEIYTRWVAEKKSMKKQLSASAYNSYALGFSKFSDLHKRKFKSIRLDELQKCFSNNNHMSLSSVNKMTIVINGMYNYAMKYEIAEKDYSKFVTAEYTEREPIHKSMTEEEVQRLWKENAKEILILIYTGMRITELFEMKKCDVYLNDRYMIGGIKTEAGKNRMIPIHEKIVPILKEFMTSKGEYLLGKKYIYQTFLRLFWNAHFPNQEHLTHDCRHTCASMMEKAGIPLFHRKLILGHAITDITEGTYTHVDIKDLIEDINKI